MRGTRASVVKSSNGGTPGGMMRSNTACSSGGKGDGTGSTRGAVAVIECSFGTDGEIRRVAAQPVTLNGRAGATRAPGPLERDVGQPSETHSMTRSARSMSEGGTDNP